MTLIQDLPVPVIAMVNNFIAKAAGCQLVASCDIAVATDKSSFVTPGVNVGLFCSTPGVAIGRAVSREFAMMMMFTGGFAQEALLHGLVSKVVHEECLKEETLAITHRICESSRPVVPLGKAAFQKQTAQSRDAAYATVTAVMVVNLALHDGQEGIQAFIEKCQPLWTNRMRKHMTNSTNKPHK
ncbi:enoyl-CoA hydratase domain-containing protein 3, mitochondrial isoform X1 [Tachysurus ichikawai]